MRRLVLVVAVAALLPVLASAQDASPIPVSSPVASPIASDVGRTVRWQDWTITLTGAEFADAVALDTYSEEHARGKYLIVRLTATNESREPDTFPIYDVRAIDGQGRRFDLDYDATSALLSEETGFYPSLDNLQPGITYPYVLVFDVAPDASGFALLLMGTGDLVLNLGI